MREFLANNRDELIRRCKVKVSERPRRAATEAQLRNGIPLFLEQLTTTLKAEKDGNEDDSLRISGPPGGDVAVPSEIGISAAAHGKQLLELGYTVNQVVHDYGACAKPSRISRWHWTRRSRCRSSGRSTAAWTTPSRMR